MNQKKSMNFQMKRQERLANFDILRILAMFLVVVGHYIFQGLGTNINYIHWDVSTNMVNYIMLEFTYIIASIAVNCFVLITGYFCIDKIDFRWRGIIDIYFTTLFYSVTFLLLAIILDKEVTKRTLLLSIMPIRQEQYWFVSSYVGLMMVAPFLARFASLINKKQYKILLGTLFVLSFEYLYGCLYAGFKSILFFSFLFFIAGYIKYYGVSQKWRKNKGMIVLIIWIAYFVIATFINLVFCNKSQFVLIYFVNNGLTLFLSIAVFVYFANTDIKGNRSIFLWKISPYVFGVYLFHDNPFFRNDLWNILIPDQYHIPIVLHCFIVSITIFFAGVLVDYFRQVIFRWIRIDKVEEWLVMRMPVIG